MSSFLNRVHANLDQQEKDAEKIAQAIIDRDLGKLKSKKSTIKAEKIMKEKIPTTGSKITRMTLGRKV